MLSPAALPQGRDGGVVCAPAADELARRGARPAAHRRADALDGQHGRRLRRLDRRAHEVRCAHTPCYYAECASLIQCGLACGPHYGKICVRYFWPW